MRRKINIDVPFHNDDNGEKHESGGRGWMKYEYQFNEHTFNKRNDMK